MAVNPPNMGALSSRAGQLVVQARDTLADIVNFNAYIQALGVDGLVALGFTSDDADLMLTVYTNLSAVAAVVNGAEYAGPTLPHNFAGESIPLWGGV